MHEEFKTLDFDEMQYRYNPETDAIELIGSKAELDAYFTSEGLSMEGVTNYGAKVVTDVTDATKTIISIPLARLESIARAEASSSDADMADLAFVMNLFKTAGPFKFKSYGAPSSIWDRW